ncbi:MAG TPA: hypothetical protein VJ767_07295 [Nitrososphaeraceae archaeon]|nr:hypothetical protein [Nitrososphaeraceae archaeon]
MIRLSPISLLNTMRRTFRIEMIKLDLPTLYKQKPDRFLKLVHFTISYFAIFDSHSEDDN